MDRVRKTITVRLNARDLQNIKTIKERVHLPVSFIIRRALEEMVRDIRRYDEVNEKS